MAINTIGSALARRFITPTTLQPKLPTIPTTLKPTLVEPVKTTQEATTQQPIFQPAPVAQQTTQAAPAEVPTMNITPYQAPTITPAPEVKTTTPAPAPSIKTAESPLVMRAQDLAMQGIDPALSKLMTDKATGLLNNPSMGYDFQKEKDLAMENYNIQKAKAMEALRSKLAPTLNAGVNIEGLANVALSDVLGREQLGQDIDKNTAERMRADIANALAAGSTASGIAESTLGTNLAALSTAGNIKNAQSAEERLAASGKLQEAMQTYDLLSQTDPDAANKYLNDLLRSGTLGETAGGVQVKPMTQEEKIQQEYNNQLLQFKLYHPEAFDAQGNMTPEGRATYQNLMDKAIFGADSGSVNVESTSQQYNNMDGATQAATIESLIKKGAKPESIWKAYADQVQENITPEALEAGIASGSKTAKDYAIEQLKAGKLTTTQIPSLIDKIDITKTDWTTTDGTNIFDKDSKSDYDKFINANPIGSFRTIDGKNVVINNIESSLTGGDIFGIGIGDEWRNMTMEYTDIATGKKYKMYWNAGKMSTGNGDTTVEEV